MQRDALLTWNPLTKLRVHAPWHFGTGRTTGGSTGTLQRQAGLHEQPGLRFGRAGLPIDIGARVRVWGGYDFEPTWLPEPGGIRGVQGTVCAFVRERGDRREHAVIKLDGVHKVGEATGNYLVLVLQRPAARWHGGETVSVELCPDPPESPKFRKRKLNPVVEAAAICELI